MLAESQAKKLPQIVLIGRTNVGKSTLFNKLTEKRLALVSNEPGTTRDIKKAVINWNHRDFELIDTGGLTTEHFKSFRKKSSSDDIIFQTIKRALNAAKQANLILFVVSAKDGLTIEDREIGTWLIKRGLSFILLANKTDNQKLRLQTAEFAKLGQSLPLAVSAASGAGTGDLLDAVINRLSKSTLERNDGKVMDRNLINVAIIGRPNVGKSTLLNQLVGEPLVIVSPQPHTTREPIDTIMEYKNRLIRIIDTAGIRRKARIPLTSVEKTGVMMSLNTIKQADVVLFVTDIAEQIAQQDQKLISEILKYNCGLLVIANKADLLKQQTTVSGNTYATIEKNLRRTFSYASWAYLFVMSSLSTKNNQKILAAILTAYHNRHQQLTDAQLNLIIKKAAYKQPVPKPKNAKRRTIIQHVYQADINPPLFIIKTSGKHEIPNSYLRYLEKAIRTNFDFSGTPIIIKQQS